MAITVGVNTYGTEAEANAYFLQRVNAEDWDTAIDPEAALVSAARRLDQESFQGVRTDSTQAMAWPRTGATDEDGYAIASDAYPAALKRAQFELALALLSDDMLAETGLEGFESVKVGPLDVTPRHGHKAGRLPANVRREIAHLLRAGEGSVRLIRG